MRRGHPNRGGWRSEGSRPFRPRMGVSSGYRPRNYFQPGLDSPRFPTASRFPFRAPHSYGPMSGPSGDHEPDYQNHNKYSDRDLHNKFSKSDSYHETNDYYKSSNYDNYHVNSMGDIDQRKPYHKHQPEYKQHDLTTWVTKHPKPYLRSSDQLNDIPTYSGHRPPASDHYVGKSTLTNDNLDSFSRSVDDTVDIIRKKLKSRNDPQTQQQSEICESNKDERPPLASNYQQQFSQIDQIAKKKPPPRPKQNLKTNCDNVKSKIVHQLFKMDKDRIHKLMDNPNSSSKFEFAISSLITESQNSLNRHLRNVAEKSLNITRNEIIQYNENETDSIYEDTFIKQMQCVLEPQDTVFLEDIKPIVLAEINKVLQSNEFAIPTYDVNYASCQNFDDSSENQNYYNNDSQFYEDIVLSNEQDINFGEPSTDSDLYARRISNDSNKYSELRRQSINERRQVRDPNSFDYESSEAPEITISGPYFDTNDEQNMEEDDPFAELDNQYHVPVDPSFIADDIEFSHSTSLEQNLDHSLPGINKNTEILTKPSSSNNMTPKPNNIKKENTESDKYNSIQSKIIDNVTIEKEKLYESKEECKSESCNLSTDKNSNGSNSRKRIYDQRPSHRKEKRKKSDSIPPDNLQILENNDIVDSDCLSKSLENNEVIKKIFYDTSFSKDKEVDHSKENKHSEEEYSEKYVKRKESPRSSKDKKNTNKRKSTSSTSNHSSSNAKNITKTDSSKNKLKTIDMFLNQPRKSTASHHAHRNTAASPAKTSNNEEKLKTPIISISKVTKKQTVSTQTVRKVSSKESQTIRKKYLTKHIQTEPVCFTRSEIKSTDVFERMKEIDLEIQQLVQEKLKLYQSIESKDPNNRSMQNSGVGLTVLNMSPMEDKVNQDEFNADTIIDEFTSIPEEELAEIALETAEHEMKSPVVEKKTQKSKATKKQAKTYESPSTKRNRKNRTPNISLIEKIILDDTPLEEIISLDDLEGSPVKIKSKSNKKNKNTNKSKIEKAKLQYNIKECFVVLLKNDLTRYLTENKLKDENKIININEDKEKIEVKDFKSIEYGEVEISDSSEELFLKDVIKQETELKEMPIEAIAEVVEDIVNDFQFQVDMLDVSEDIVIDCEVKDDKESTIVLTSEEVVLDNSQCNEIEEVPESPQIEPCKMYDFSSEEFRHDTTSVVGNADAVLAIECIGNNFLAACLDGNVYYFSNDGQLLATLRGSNLAVTCLTIVNEKYGTTVYTGSLDSRIRYYDLETGFEKGPECNVLSPIQTMDRAWDTVFVGTRTGFVLQFECRNNMLIPISTIKFSEQSILSLRAMKEGPRKVLLVAARSENVTIKDAQTGLLLRTLCGPKMTVYTLLYEDGKVYCGTSSNQIHVFDYASGSHIGDHEGGKGAVCLLSSGGILFAGCYDGCVYVFRAGERTPFALMRGPNVMLLSLTVLGSKIIVGYKDRSLYIWKIPVNILKEMVL